MGTGMVTLSTSQVHFHHQTVPNYDRDNLSFLRLHTKFFTPQCPANFVRKIQRPSTTKEVLWGGSQKILFSATKDGSRRKI
uniref:Uncharacterized protein n=1 Tax=Timema poppense TaxID=170557 RepID=A0A7R9DND2_TIMPO|nr:unnamed protein product [Timema poppensis]